ncbi:hypothetical protein HPP92_001196 [Vanilla planifolia]|uniref:Uncharacterized protein n=1 Tax=Vanilla planifolia TaxID=51239 RepID=A0A835RZE9_VANPL|nr:hypothetical protein HPP92_001196 [Vanilla planifolia]
MEEMGDSEETWLSDDDDEDDDDAESSIIGGNRSDDDDDDDDTRRARLRMWHVHGDESPQVKSDNDGESPSLWTSARAGVAEENRLFWETCLADESSLSPNYKID